MKKLRILLIATGVLAALFASAAYAGDLRFADLDDFTYLLGSPADGWLEESFNTEKTDINFSLANEGKDTITGATLVLAVPFSATDTSWQLRINGSSWYSLADFINTGDHPVLPPHGVYQDGVSKWFEYSLGTILEDSFAPIHMEIQNAQHGTLIHADAYGYNGDKPKFVPPSHDLNFTAPEPVSALLLLGGGSALAFFRRRKRVK